LGIPIASGRAEAVQHLLPAASSSSTVRRRTGRYADRDERIARLRNRKSMHKNPTHGHPTFRA
jgi:hypothetical protein